MIALPNQGFLRVGQWSARHTGAVAREEVPAWEAKFVNPVAGIPFGMWPTTGTLETVKRHVKPFRQRSAGPRQRHDPTAPGQHGPARPGTRQRGRPVVLRR